MPSLHLDSTGVKIDACRNRSCPRAGGGCCTPISDAALDPAAASEGATVFKALADPVRLRLMSIIASAGDEVCVCDLTPLFDVSAARRSPTICEFCARPGWSTANAAARGSTTGRCPSAWSGCRRCCRSPRPPAQSTERADPTTREIRALIIGGGQAGLATAFYLRRAGLTPGEDFVILDASDQPGGAWSKMWPTLRTFSPTQHSSLPGWMMPPWTGDDGYPLAAHVVDYLTQYEDRYQLAVRRPVRVTSVRYGDRGRLVVSTDHGDWLADHVISATGTWSRPFIPNYPGHFAGRQLHTAQYRQASDFTGQRVMIVGGGNSAAQILAEVSNGRRYNLADAAATSFPPRRCRRSRAVRDRHQPPPSPRCRRVRYRWRRRTRRHRHGRQRPRGPRT